MNIKSFLLIGTGIKRSETGRLNHLGVICLLLLQLSVAGQNNQPRTFYIDADNGSDLSDGNSKLHPWKTLDKVNDQVFIAGDKILLKAGSSWIGSFHPRGSGSAKQPIIIDQYDKGPKPIINGNGLTGHGVLVLNNQSNWEINNLEIINNAAQPGDRRGVEISASNYGLVQHIHLKNMTIHDIKGIAGHGLPEKRTAGIYFTVAADSILPTRYHDILIENCLIYNIQNQGIVTNNEVSQSDYPGTAAWQKRKFTGMVIRNNVIHHISKNAMIIRLSEGGIVEHNLCYETALGITGNTIFSRSCLGTVFQYNEGYLNRSPDYDGSLYDADISSPGTIWQYSYSHDNAHGLMWFCTDQKDTGVIVRYNISQNDKGNLVYINYPFTSAKIYNNVFYTDQQLSPVILIENGKNRHNYQFLNNIIYNESNNAKYRFAPDTAKGKQDRVISNNIFFGIHSDEEPGGSSNFRDDPLFVKPGSGKTGLTSLSGYMLQEGSPAFGKGGLIENNGGKDFWGNTVPLGRNPNIGAYNGKAQGRKATAVSAAADRVAGKSAVLEITESEVNQEMEFHRADVLDRFVSKYGLTDASDFWERKFEGSTPLEFLREVAKKAIVSSRLNEQLLRDFNCWEAGISGPFGPVKMADRVALENRLAKGFARLGRVFFGVALMR